VENKRENDAGRFLLWRKASDVKFSPIVFTAALSVIVFLTVIGWRATRIIETTNPVSFANAARVNAVQGNARYAGGVAGASDAVFADSSEPNDFSRTQYDVFGQLLGTYVALKKAGTYTEEKGADVANRIAEAVVAPVSYTAFTRNNTKTDADTSYNRTLSYRNDFQVALAPLLLNSESELGIFNDYVQTHDKNFLTVLGEVAGRYHKTVGLLSAMTVPEDAIDYHLAVTNSLLQFAVTLEAMIKNADDPMAVLALLRTYNTAEDGVYNSFNSLAAYLKRKAP
jgi:hypothetical protein